VALIGGLSLASGCRDAGEWMKFTGGPETEDGWGETYEYAPADVWEAFRVVARDNGTIEEEDPTEMSLKGEYKPHDSTEWDGVSIRGQVYDKSEDGKVAARLIVHAWYAKNANDRARQDTARDYCNTVFKVLKQWKGEKIDEEPTVSTSSEDPVKPDEAIGFFKVTPEQAYSACKAVVAKYGSVEQDDPKGLFLRGVKTNALEDTKDEVRVFVYDRTEQESIRSKVSIRVRAGEDNEAMQEVARSYMTEIRKELEKQFGPQE
jgi:hypothetical protein